MDDILNGYNGTVFAYGQTGAGKSYTMMGSDIDNSDTKGIIPRIVEQIFASILASPGNIEYTVRVSYMEIYMEKIRDLLQPQNDNLPIHEEKNRGVYVKGLLEIYVSSVQEVYEVMRRGGNARAVAATNMNQESSRSHSIFVITVTQKNVETGSAKSGQLFLVDLAGSEKVGKTGASGQTLEEAKKINKSLSALGMVINSLTDGKSTHIPYRDSKLTRILQESLGGNSRTTLIINCSPASYNAEETLSTLRFGVRAKAIKNKAKINAELSPAELKALLRKAQSQITNFETYVANLEGEVGLWRGGEAVPKDKWTQPLTADGVSNIRAESRTPRPGTPSLLPNDPRVETPGRSDSRLGERSNTPVIALEKDEREEFLRRENELQDQLAEKESLLAAAERSLEDGRTEVKLSKESSIKASQENEKLGTEMNELKMHLERLAFEGKEVSITMDSLKEANSELTAELDEIKQQLLDARMSAKDSSSVLDEKQKKKAERMAQMMAGFDIGDDGYSENEKKIQYCIDQIQAIYEAGAAGEPINLDQLEELKSSLEETQRMVHQAEAGLNNRPDANDTHVQKRQVLDQKLAAMQQIYQSLLEQNLSPADAAVVKSQLEESYTISAQIFDDQIAILKDDMAKKVEENSRLQNTIDELERQHRANVNGSSTPRGKSVQQQIADFDVMKKSLMRDLQNRCERVVELEISLDETREQYNNVLRTSNNRAQQKKMAFLERNLEQLTHVQRQLVEQNGGLKKEVAIAERKLIARNERIHSLEALLSDSQEKLIASHHRQVFHCCGASGLLTLYRFETQLAAVKERLEAAKMGSTRGLGGQGDTPNAYAFNSMGSRIAKPLRGGGGDSYGGPVVPTFSNLQMQESAQQNKRMSWFSRG